MDVSELDAHVRAILGSARVRNKIVVLCEGDRLTTSQQNWRPCPQSYKAHKHLPDSSFYRNCLSRSWGGRGLPQFYNCGGRSSVLRTYTELRERQAADPSSTHLDPDRLFAMVDLDLQNAACPEGYLLDSLEAVFAALYDRCRVRPEISKEHKIWTTALIHKEAYFLLPHALDRVSSHPCGAFFDDSALSQSAVWNEALTRLDPKSEFCDADLVLNFSNAKGRLAAFAPDLPAGHVQLQRIEMSWC